MVRVFREGYLLKFSYCRFFVCFLRYLNQWFLKGFLEVSGEMGSFFVFCSFYDWGKLLVINVGVIYWVMNKDGFVYNFFI